MVELRRTLRLVIFWIQPFLAWWILTMAAESDGFTAIWFMIVGYFLFALFCGLSLEFKMMSKEYEKGDDNAEA